MYNCILGVHNPYKMAGSCTIFSEVSGVITEALQKYADTAQEI